MTDLGTDRKNSQNIAPVAKGQGGEGQPTTRWQDKRRCRRAAKPLLQHALEACRRSVEVPRCGKTPPTTTSCAAPGRFSTTLTP
jgi:hypothetical protein